MKSFVTSVGFSILEGIAQRQIDGRDAGACIGERGEGVVRIPPVEELFR